MVQLLRQPDKGKTPPSVPPFRSIGAIPLGTNAQLDVQVGMADGAKVVSFRNAMRQGRAGMCPAGVGAIVGADRIPELIELLQRAVAPQAVAS